MVLKRTDKRAVSERERRQRMTVKTADSIFKQVIRDKGVVTKRRVTALDSMARPSIRFLSEIAGDENNPSRLRMAAVERLEVAVQLQRAMKKLAAKEKHIDRKQGDEIGGDSAGQPVEGTGA
jgi:hypothetical protein